MITVRGQGKGKENLQLAWLGSLLVRGEKRRYQDGNYACACWQNENRGGGYHFFRYDWAKEFNVGENGEK